jgi:hypothetical protein
MIPRIELTDFTTFFEILKSASMAICPNRGAICPDRNSGLMGNQEILKVNSMAIRIINREDRRSEFFFDMGIFSC